MVFYFFVYIIKFILFFIPLLVAIAFLTLLERKIIASMQQRKGPNVVGFLGLLQPLADGFKLIVKETLLPSFASTLLFLFAPIITFACAILLWFAIPFNTWVSLASINLNVLYILIISSLSVYGIIFAGWASNSKYAFLGALRSAAQMISYEVSLGLIILNIVVFTDSLNLSDIIEIQQDIWFIVPLFPAFILFFISALAETNRTPFDLPEAEGELVAGYNVEYSALTFALFFLAEYSNIIFMSVLCTILFLGGNNFNILYIYVPVVTIVSYIVSIILLILNIFVLIITSAILVVGMFLVASDYITLQFFYDSFTLVLHDFYLPVNNMFFDYLIDSLIKEVTYSPEEIYISEDVLLLYNTIVFTIKVLCVLFLFIWVRATYPRYRYDQLMTLGWKVFLPITLGYSLINYVISLMFNFLN